MWSRSLRKRPIINLISDSLNGSLSKYGNCSVTCMQHGLTSTRYQSSVNEASWAAEELKRKGEKLAPPPDKIVLVDDEYYKKPSEKVKSLVQEILMLNVVEISQLLNILQERLGITDEQVYMATGVNRHGSDFSKIDAMRSSGNTTEKTASTTSSSTTKAAPAEEKTSFVLKLGAVDAKVKIKVIKEVRTITGLGLKEAKELVEKAPVVLKEGVKKEDVENFKKLLVDAGATVEVL